MFLALELTKQLGWPMRGMLHVHQDSKRLRCRCDFKPEQNLGSTKTKRDVADEADDDDAIFAFFSVVILFVKERRN